ncbi:hypothetical protein IP88_11640 [alpha proteobacterium AAP81b]|nr:hypothetical protein IP88_11640 [alpha proteobacterium AAP81b]
MPALLPLLGQALGRDLAADERLGIAVSGGPDSMALLWLAHAELPGRILALTVDHRLRTESAAEAALVAGHCAALGIDHRTLVWEGDRPATGVAAAARAARYGLLAAACRDAGAGLLLTGHHADDQAETLLMRLARGAGVTGLGGMRAARRLADGVILVRPLLGVRRAELAAIVAAAGWPQVADPSNDDEGQLRIRARRLLASADWLPPDALATAAANLADAEAALAWAAERAWAGAAAVDGDGLWLDAADLPGELRNRLVRRALAQLMPDAAPRGPEVTALLAVLARGGTATLAGVRASGRDGRWCFRRAPPRLHARGKVS